jgi:hypothetical protein
MPYFILQPPTGCVTTTSTPKDACQATTSLPVACGE